MLKPYVLLLLLFLSGFTFSEASTIDSLEGQLRKPLPDTTKIKLLLEIGKTLTEQGDYTAAIQKLSEAEKISGVRVDPTTEVMVLKQLGVTYFYMGDNNEAIKNWERARAIAEKYNFREHYFNIKMNIANALMANGNFLPALQSYFEVMKWAESANKRPEAAKCLINLAVLYGSQNRNDSARHYLYRVLREYNNDMSAYSKVNVLNNLASIAVAEGNPDSMIRFGTALLNFSTKENLSRFIASAKEVLGIAAMNKKQRIQARDYMNEAVQICDSGDDLRGKFSVISRITELNMDAIQQKDSAYLRHFYHGSRAKALSETQDMLDTLIIYFKEQNETEQLASAYQTYSHVAKEQGKPWLALDYFVLYKQLNDSLFNAERDKQLTEKAMTFAFEKKESAIRAENEKKLQKQRFIRNSVGIGLMITLVFLRITWRQRNRINAERKRNDELLLNILPAEVAKELKESERTKARRFESVTILFTDFKGFTQISENITPEQLVNELNECFTAFDHICMKYGIEKIKTIGDAYMAAGGLPVSNTTHAGDVVQAALDIQQFMQEHKLQKQAEGKLFFEIRIGIHTGPVVAGVVGVKKFAYDIWGDTVNTASRMESSGEAGKVNISGATYQLVKDQFKCVHRGKIAAKNKGETDMYFVEARS